MTEIMYMLITFINTLLDIEIISIEKGTYNAQYNIKTFIDKK